MSHHLFHSLHRRNTERWVEKTFSSLSICRDSEEKIQSKFSSLIFQ
ncbi:hypothetical protein RchiOBHm_Chr5g0067141 [Rosa chinensis]|uniref:Uncharacterized protein n=1 Tax=Rosa chinensis TaxID=74649 RepID=A0A2P6QJD2_ROSCH|nr:hypothetical protein RchiOBHm_Chr5g0067141 [Rosa chinensis]